MSSLEQLSPPYPLIQDSLKRGLVIPFLGAGASLSATGVDQDKTDQSVQSLPSAAELTDQLAEKARFPKNEAMDLAKVAQYYSLMGGRSPLYHDLHSIFDKDYPLTPLHQYLARLERPNLIVTTNYDDLIERAFAAQGKVFDVVVHTCDPDNLGDKLLWLEHGATQPTEVHPNKLDINMEEVTVIYKMHGGIDRHSPNRDQYVITEDDYIDFLTRMTKNRAIPAILAEAFQSRHFLFLGYSLRDWNLRVVLNRIQDSRRASDITSWSIQYKPSLMERKFWEKRRVEVFDMTLDEFVQDLAVIG